MNRTNQSTIRDALDNLCDASKRYAETKDELAEIKMSDKAGLNMANVHIIECTNLHCVTCLHEAIQVYWMDYSEAHPEVSTFHTFADDVPGELLDYVSEQLAHPLH